jgi:hypothetical protein
MNAYRLYGMRIRLAARMSAQWVKAPHDGYSRARLADLDRRLTALFREAWVRELAK